MQYNSPNKPKERARAYLRVPADLPAEVFVDALPYKKGSIKNLSVEGLLMQIERECELPDFFELQFTLPASRDAIKAKMKLKNKIVGQGMTRFGCGFINLPVEEREWIHEYILKFVDCSKKWTFINTAAFFLFLDALFRIFLYSIDVSYAGTEFGMSVPGKSLSIFYGVVLFLYAAASLIAFTLNDNIKQKDFLLRMRCMSAAAVFITVKNIMAWKLYLHDIVYRDSGLLLCVESVVVIYAALALLSSVSLRKKISFIAESFNFQRQTTQEKDSSS